MIQKLISFVAYKLIWLSGVWGSTVGIAFLTPILAVMYALYVLRQQSKKGLFMIYLACITMFGIVLESLVLHKTAYAFTPPRTLIPYWLMAIWVAFPCVCATTLKQAIKSPILAICIGAIFGPLAYQGAASIGSIELINGANGLGTLSVVWGTLLFMIHRWMRLFD
ncbi:MAG: DUF2878 domain-containing protein [Candidatus Marinamargulisbacteria bacterium]